MLFWTFHLDLIALGCESNHLISMSCSYSQVIFTNFIFPKVLVVCTSNVLGQAAIYKQRDMLLILCHLWKLLLIVTMEVLEDVFMARLVTVRFNDVNSLHKTLVKVPALTQPVGRYS